MDAPNELAAYPELDGFRLIQELGRSPKGIVYKARRLVEQDIVAVKVYREGAQLDPIFRTNLPRNAESTFLLEHPGIVRCLGCQEDHGRLLLVMENARGEPLSRALQRNVRFLPPRALSIAIQCADALHYAYQRHRFHGRLHPGDVILGDEEVRILNIGLGERPEHTVWDARDPHLFEPLVYTASEAMPSKGLPEAEEFRRAMDLYSLGALLYHMLTGSPPFRGTDEGALLQERQSIQPSVVRWPRGAEKTLPQRSVAIVERLLSPEAGHRGVYEALLAGLDEALREAEGRPMAAPQSVSAPPPPLAPAEIEPPPDPQPPANAVHAPAPIPVQNFAAPRRNGVHRFQPQQEERRGERISTALLIGATGIVFASAMALAAKVFLFTPAAPAAGQNPTAVAPVNPGATPENKSALTQMEAEQDAEAARQLENFKSLRERGIAKNNTASLGILDNIMRKTKSDSPTRMEAELIKGEIEAAIAQAGGKVGGATAQNPGPTDAEEKVFQDLLTNAREMVSQQRFGAAIKSLKDLPTALKMAPYPEKAANEAANIEQQAKARFAELSQDADKAVAEGNFARARDIYQGIQARFEIPSLSDSASARAKAVTEAEDKAVQNKAAQEAQKAKASETTAFATQAKAAAEKAANFNYAAAKDELDKFAQKATDADLRKVAADYTKLIQDEAWLFNRCRARLKDAIDRDPKHGSPLAGYNEKGELLFEIVDFDDKGITFVTHKGGAVGQRVREWSTISRTQHLETMKGVMDKDSSQEQLALAVMAFHRRIAAEFEARALINDSAKLDKVKTQIRDLKKAFEDSLNLAVQSDGAARDRQAAEKALLEKLAELVLAQ